MSHSFILIEIEEGENRAFDTLQTAANYLVDSEGDGEGEFPAKDYLSASRYELCTNGAYESWNILNDLEEAIGDLQKSLQAEHDEEKRYGTYEQQHRQTISDVL